MPSQLPAPPRLILASGSPRRRVLLEEAGFRFDVEPADVDEAAHAHDSDRSPSNLAEYLAELKASAVAQKHLGQAAVILAADTVVVSARGELLGKAEDRAEAGRILRSLAGTTHSVVTGFCCIRCSDGRRTTGSAVSEVLMRPLEEAEIEAYLDSGQWEGKAGAYGIQDDPGRRIGEGDPFIESVSGELTNIVGLPMPQVIDALAEVGVRVESGHHPA